MHEGSQSWSGRQGNVQEAPRVVRSENGTAARRKENRGAVFRAGRHHFTAGLQQESNLPKPAHESASGPIPSEPYASIVATRELPQPDLLNPSDRL